MSDDLRASREFQSYLRARDAVLRMKGGGTSTASPSAYWSEELDNIDYMIDASPLIVRKLRQHAFHITGIRPYDYRNKNDGRREFFEARLQALRSLDPLRQGSGGQGYDALLVPESPAMGGFGYPIGDRLINVDTIKFFEVLIGMERGGVMGAIRAIDRPVVCEIGAGWGGFIYQLKTLLPRATYVLVDFPELFLFSATYLGAMFPDARLLFVGAEGTASIDGWRDADFVFVPHSLSRLASTLPLDLTVNMVSFQEMTDAQVRAYAGIAADAGCPLIYSLNRERSPYNTELVRVSDALADRYRLTEISVLGTDYTSAMKKPPKAGAPVERSDFNYRHLVGRLDRSARVSGTVVQGDSASTRSSGQGARVVIGMTLYNNARHLPEAMDSLLAQTCGDFQLVLLDDASVDDTEKVAREYERRDPRVRYFRHATRRAMVETWRHVVEIAQRECPSAEYFAWASDHDRWHPQWLERLLGEVDGDREAVLAYPITRRMTQDGVDLDKGPRLFDTVDCTDRRARWKRLCHHGIGAGDMVYGLIRLDALRQAGVFRAVLRPDRLLIAELALYGRFRQVPEVLWFRRESNGSSIERQRHSLVLPGEEPNWFGAPPWLQHALSLWREYAAKVPPPLPISKPRWAAMLVRYQLTYGWRHFRKTEASHAIGRGIDNAIWVKKITKHHWHHAVYNTLVGTRAAWGRARRTGRRAVYETLMLTHRLGLRGGSKHEP
jgi:glycosyltransferase involved in cell wall biosynthesis